MALDTKISEYLHYCEAQKRLDEKTMKAYRIDLSQLQHLLHEQDPDRVTPDMLETIFEKWHDRYKPKTVKRKMASAKAFFHWLEEKEWIQANPFDKIHMHFREPKTLPKTIPEHTLELFLQSMYDQYKSAPSEAQKRRILRDIAEVELLFGTGVRISELCGLKAEDVDLVEGQILIHGKGQKERIIAIPDETIRELLGQYRDAYEENISQCGYFFINNCGRRALDQTVRNMIKKYAEKAAISQHITPHMFRHTFATSLLESDVNLRCIQELLGHSSIQTTQIYTHVSAAKQRQVLMEHHPRKALHIER